MTPDQLPAGLPMDDKIEAWAQGIPLADSTTIAEWRYMLRHLPTLGELELTHDKCPELWGKP